MKEIQHLHCHYSWNLEDVAVHSKGLEPQFGREAGRSEQHVHMPPLITSDSPSHYKLSSFPGHLEQDEPKKF